jgi:hypothetical protein
MALFGTVEPGRTWFVAVSSPRIRMEGDCSEMKKWGAHAPSRSGIDEAPIPFGLIVQYSFILRTGATGEAPVGTREGACVPQSAWRELPQR